MRNNASTTPAPRPSPLGPKKQNTQPGCDAVACYREVPLGQENEANPKDPLIAFGEASLNGRAPPNATELDEVSAAKRGRNIARKWAAGGRSRRGVGTTGGVGGTLKPKM